MMNSITSAWQTFIYGVLKRRPAIDFSEIPQQINFTTHYDAKNQVYWAEASAMPEFYVSGKTLEELTRNIGDTVLVYFDVPHYFAKKYKDGQFSLTDPITGKVETISLNKEELNRVLA